MYFTRSEIKSTKIKRYFQKDGRHFVELEENPFYEDGAGGQIGDRGFIDSARVLYVSDLIEVDGPLNAGSTVEIKIDSERRKEIARQHTAQHIISAVIEKHYGAKTVGFHMGEEDTTIDLDGTFNIEETENFSNDIVLSNLKVEEIILTPEEASKYELRKDLSEKAIKSGNVRLIKIEDFDLNACGGFHVGSTSEIGIIKITHSERVKGGLTRIWFVAGKRALKDYQMKSQVLYESAKIFDASWMDLKARIQKSLDDLKEKNATLKKMAEKLANYISKEIHPFEILELDESVASFLTRIRQDIPYAVKISGTNNVSFSLPNYDRSKVMDTAKILGIKGGGNGPIYRFATENPAIFMEKIREG
ncbi:alanyl-tRNA editing protein [Athalassotoga saccharophila]|uniref:alanyl-tRNA editing protein n=1 Tax=Athalassotoga saccharophila TaxID=1441386 RepID=UPI00137A976F|nr:alanyl-tRNA editing protein [Athalassotoga saccharophila]BBJ27398.1 alanine--tRNA ligase [Athalassotoga saccharophila]